MTGCPCFFAPFCGPERQPQEPRACEHFARLVKLWRLVRALNREVPREPRVPR